MSMFLGVRKLGSPLLPHLFFLCCMHLLGAFFFFFLAGLYDCLLPFLQAYWDRSSGYAIVFAW